MVGNGVGRRVGKCDVIIAGVDEGAKKIICDVFALGESVGIIDGAVIAIQQFSSHEKDDISLMSVEDEPMYELNTPVGRTQLLLATSNIERSRVETVKVAFVVCPGDRLTFSNATSCLIGELVPWGMPMYSCATSLPDTDPVLLIEKVNDGPWLASTDIETLKQQKLKVV